ncbi:T-cell surface glycoprotein CD3 gamma chain isoform X1 [Scleropages formosus]|uniref:CD3 delta subunit of T-cell receptor complex n=1 Tax=Scleropages formosus TaxID=113540 RepID=A0A8C9R749_SCLFO|nr:T-cell surface glycoprotein CD3 gamma chain-like isoform X1 [Scleropages formosus]XP_018603907.1 T-cell surface glycoprotein CD3 gamma chain-like isoform X1 [Scleropages formosus]
MRRVFSLVLLLLFSLTETAAQNLKIKADQVAGDRIQLTCENGEWVERQDDSESKHQLLLAYKDENSKEYICKDKDEKNVKILVKFRTCDNCVALESSTVAGIVSADIVATVLIGVAVYFIASQPRGRSYSNSKASDRQTLLSNQPNDTYMPLTQGHSSEYSKLERRANRK